MGKKDLKGFEYIGDVPAYNNMTAQRVYLPLYVKFIKGIKFFATENHGLERPTAKINLSIMQYAMTIFS